MTTTSHFGSFSSDSQPRYEIVPDDQMDYSGFSDVSAVSQGSQMSQCDLLSPNSNLAPSTHAADYPDPTPLPTGPLLAIEPNLPNKILAQQDWLPLDRRTRFDK